GGEDENRYMGSSISFLKDRQIMDREGS
ncbi:MAG: hypothetical protein JWP63_5709, partial [Candidatus Solibacter sp.]|nr:hypothetical protein [Candidatus Solibacter sp.]